MRVEFLEHQARLNVPVVLILARILFNRPANLMVEDLADGYARVDPNRVDREHFERPIAAEPHVAETGRHMDK